MGLGLVRRWPDWALAALGGGLISVLLALLNAKPLMNSLQRLFLADMASNPFYWIMVVAVIAWLSRSAARACWNNIAFHLTMCLTYYPLVWVAELVARQLGYSSHFPLLDNLLSSWPWFVMAALTGPLGWLLRHIRQPGWLSWVAMFLPVLILESDANPELFWFDRPVSHYVGYDVVFLPATAFDYANQVAVVVLYAGFIVWWADRFHRARADRRRSSRAAAGQARALESPADD